MSTITVDCSRLNGEVRVPMSKSILHRYLICNYIDGNYDDIENIEAKAGRLSDDVIATKDCLMAIINNDKELRCRESGTTLRFLMPLVAAMGYECELIAERSLVGRPMKEFIDELNRHGADISYSKSEDGSEERYSVKGKLTEGDYELPGNISSQYISGLMLASDLIDGDAWIIIEDGVASEPYIDMTAQVIKAYDMGRQEMLLEGDWSGGAMWVVANDLLGGRLKVNGLQPASLQGDSRIIDILNDFAIEQLIAEEYGSRDLRIDASDWPDIVPAIALKAVAAALSEDGHGLRTVITGAGRLKFKECNRLQAIAAILSKLGANIIAGNDGDSLIINRMTGSKIPGCDEAIDTYGDHRMVMLAAMASIITEKPVKVDGYEAVAKSYPAFFEDIERMGGLV